MIDRTWVNINKANLVSNFKSLSKKVGKEPKKMSVVKSNAYGHGMIECAKILDKAGTDFFGVDSFSEAVSLRQSKIRKPILVLGFTDKNNFAEASRKNISLTISNLKSLKDLAKTNYKVKIHIKADTGLHRQGFLENDIEEVKRILSKNNNIELEGLYTHLAGAESKKFEQYTKKQVVNFNKWIDQLSELNKKILTHCSASAASIIYPETRFKMVRFGISIYGLWASNETKKNSSAHDVILKPVMEWQSILTEVKKIPKGSPVGYDCSEKVKRNSVIGIIPVGYWHGYPRHASKKAFVLISGKRAKILGKVSMDMIIIDLTNIKKPKQGDIVTLIGNKISADELAEHCDTINYEIVTRVNSLIPRIIK